MPPVQRAQVPIRKLRPGDWKASGGAASNAPLITTAATAIGVVGIGYYLAQLL